MNQAEFRQKMSESYNMEELRLIAFDLGIDFDNLPAGSKDGKIADLMDYCRRAGRLSDLETIVRRERPNVNWPIISSGTPGVPLWRRMRYSRIAAGVALMVFIIVLTVTMMAQVLAGSYDSLLFTMIPLVVVLGLLYAVYFWPILWE